MSFDIAPANIRGRLVDRPTVNYTQSGKAVANFKVAWVRSYYNNESQEWQDSHPTVYTRCSAWGTLGENIADSLNKGAPVIVQGRWVPNKYPTKIYDSQNNEIIDPTTGQPVTKEVTSMEVMAEHVGVDLRWGTVMYQPKSANNASQQPQGNGNNGGWGAPQNNGFNAPQQPSAGTEVPQQGNYSPSAGYPPQTSTQSPQGNVNWGSNNNAPNNNWGNQPAEEEPPF